MSEEAPRPELPARYSWMRKLGAGGAGMVVQVFDRALEVERALKLLFIKEDANKRALHERVVVEARMMARLNHPNVLRVYDVALHQGLPYIVMDFARGGTLARRFKDKGAIPEDEALRMLLGLLDGLGHAHAAGIIHRDVKPQNVLFDDAGVPMLADFGIAMRTDAEVVTNRIIAGTKYYMAPEQGFASEELDLTVDLYALARTMITALRGRNPRESDPPIDKDESIPASWRPILKRACHPDPRQRYPSAEAFRAAAVAYLQPSAPAPKPSPPAALDLDALKTAYVARLHDRIETLELLLSTSKWSPTERDELRRVGHQLKGSGGTYGYHQLSQAGALVEDADDTQLRAATQRLYNQLVDITGSQGAAPTAEIWVLDDDPDMVAFISAVCQDLGLEVASTGSVPTFLSWFSQHRPRLFLLDLQLEGTDGRDLLAQLDLSDRQTRVVVISSHDGPELREQCVDLGASEVLRKPLTRESLRTLLRERPARRRHRTTLTLSGGRASLLAARQAAISNGHTFVFGCLSMVCPDDATVPLRDAQRAIERPLRTVFGERLILGDWQSGSCYFMVRDHARHQVELLLRAIFTSQFPTTVGDVSLSACAGLVDGRSESASRTLEQARAHAELALGFGTGEVVSESNLPKALRTVVLVEDDADLAEVVTTTLASDDVRVVHLLDGQNLLQSLEEHRAAAVLLDIELPGVGGLELLELIRNTPGYMDLPIIMVTGRAEAQHIDVAFELGANDYVQKPFSPPAFAARVRRLLKTA